MLAARSSLRSYHSISRKPCEVERHRSLLVSGPGSEEEKKRNRTCTERNRSGQSSLSAWQKRRHPLAAGGAFPVARLPSPTRSLSAATTSAAPAPSNTDIGCSARMRLRFAYKPQQALVARGAFHLPDSALPDLVGTNCSAYSNDRSGRHNVHSNTGALSPYCILQATLSDLLCGCPARLHPASSGHRPPGTAMCNAICSFLCGTSCS